MVIRRAAKTVDAIIRRTTTTMPGAQPASTPSEPPASLRCPLAPAASELPCVGYRDAVMLGIWRGDKDLVKLSGCVLHAGLRLSANPPSKVYPICPPPAKVGLALAALELARLITHGEALDLPADAVEMQVVYVGLSPW